MNLKKSAVITAISLSIFSMQGNAQSATFQTTGAYRINNSNGYLDIGPQNTSWTHFVTDRNAFYFNKPIAAANGIFGSYNTSDLYLATGSGINFNTRMTISNSTGNIGIGTAPAADARLKVNGSLLLESGTIRMGDNPFYLRPGSDINHGLAWKNTYANSTIDGPVLFGFGGGALGSSQNGDKLALYWNSKGQVGIGTSNVGSQFRFVVEGSIGVREAVVMLGQWPDYVFEKDYKLKSLTEVEAFIKEHKHLPSIPTAEEVVANGAGLGEMVKLQMQKIEELTLYLIQQQKEIDALKAQLNK